MFAGFLARTPARRQPLPLAVERLDAAAHLASLGLQRAHGIAVAVHLRDLRAASRAARSALSCCAISASTAGRRLRVRSLPLRALLARARARRSAPASIPRDRRRRSGRAGGARRARRGGVGTDPAGGARGERALEVVVVARVVVQHAVAHLDHARRERVDEGPVVRDEEQRALVAGERLLEHLAGRHVEVVGRLVEHQEICRPQQHLREREPRLLAAREHRDLLLDVVAREQEGAQVAAQPRARRPRRPRSRARRARCVKPSSVSSWCCA